ncbi:type I restriction endonuclease subunit R [Gracilimonas sediminicola]|uniref:type I restriction endonuclease subunit R n=1 Tax=Gracilimonas sediminicola TaxID=2952158 RepID=UPI0038D39210
MNTPSYIEDHSSQIPALTMLCKLGYEYLSPEKVEAMRGSHSEVLLKPILEEQLRKINKIDFHGKTYPFSNHNISAAVDKVSDAPLVSGLIKTNEKLYHLLTLGSSFEETIEGDRKSFSLHYIDWEHPENNVFHVTEEYSVQRSGSYKEYRPDIVLFVNGIPLVIIECKRPDLKMREKDQKPVDQAISQHLRNQKNDGIPGLYVYSQLLLGLAVNSNRYATTGTPSKFWSTWKEKFETREEELQYESKLEELKKISLSAEVFDDIFSDRFRYVKSHFQALQKEDRKVTDQDKILYGLCRPARLLRFIKRYTLYDAGEKKVARYQQFYAVEKTLNRIQSLEQGKRQGGVIWHTQGSGKSLSMVMLAKGIALDKSIPDARIVLVTDRVDLDDQIYETFDDCDLEPVQASTGNHLIELLRQKKRAVITTVINKFEAVVKKSKVTEESPNIFVLVDEGHRTQYGTANIRMQQTFPNACFIAFTGTPLMKQEKHTARKFGGIIDTYTIKEAVSDNAVVPLLYEGRHIPQDVNKKPIDTYFERISERLNDKEKADLKKKFSRADQLNEAEQKLMTICYDISDHFSKTWQGSGFKGQLTVHSKTAAIRCKQFLDEFGKVSSEVIISGPDSREGHEDMDEENIDIVQKFWKKMMERFGTEKEYNKQLIYQFKSDDDPEIMIVVDKLITGFDAPRNTVLYIARSLKEHKLLQAIARVNRLFEGKDFGYIIDYYGILGELDEALTTYSELQEFEEEELEGTLTDIKQEIEKLPERHAHVWDIFNGIDRSLDAQHYEQHLEDEDIRDEFYERLSLFARTLKMALSTFEFIQNTDPEKVNQYKNDAKFFMSLRSSVKARYSDSIDYGQYEKQVQKLIDTHVTSSEVVKLTEQVNIFDEEKFEQELAKVEGDAARADRIASRTKKSIALVMDEDPALYKKFSEMLEQTISDWKARRLSDAEYLNRVREIMDKVRSRSSDDIPEELQGKKTAQAIYGIVNDIMNGSKVRSEGETYDAGSSNSGTSDMGIKIDEIIQDHLVVDWQYKTDIKNAMRQDIDDYLFSLRDKGVDLTLEEMDEIIEKSIELAIRNYT